jgi:ribonuclease P protein component
MRNLPDNEGTSPVDPAFVFARQKTDDPAKPWRERRLRSHGDYQRMYAATRKQFGKHMSYFYVVRQASDNPRHRVHVGPRVGLTVGRVMGDAVTRNRIKRRLRSAVQQHFGLLGGLDLDVALHPKRGFVDLEWNALERDVAVIFRSIAKAAGKPQ